jgi:protein involved in polysaccharide export with SLBB domain
MGYSGRLCALAMAAAAAGGGCATCPAKVQAALQQAPQRTVEVTGDYAVGCPDRLSIQMSESRPLDVTVEPDGCVFVPGIGRLRVEGAAPGGIATEIAHHLNMPTPSVQVSVTEYASKHVLLFGPGDGVQRVVPYVGPEEVTDMLRRTGGLAPGAAFHVVHVVRPHVASGQRPEVFTVDLAKALDKNDAANDVKLQPSDQVYLGETRGSSLARCLPPWVRTALPGMKELDTKQE